MHQINDEIKVNTRKQSHQSKSYIWVNSVFLVWEFQYFQFRRWENQTKKFKLNSKIRFDYGRIGETYLLLFFYWFTLGCHLTRTTWLRLMFKWMWEWMNAAASFYNACTSFSQKVDFEKKQEVTRRRKYVLRSTLKLFNSHQSHFGKKVLQTNRGFGLRW